jgi:hypothetical protein
VTDDVMNPTDPGAELQPGWEGASIWLSEVSIPGIKSAREWPELSDYPPIACYVTEMRANKQIIRGYSHMADKMDSMFGNVAAKNEIIGLTIEFPTIIDINRFIEYSISSMMASQSIINNLAVEIMFGQYTVRGALLTRASISLLQGTAMATASIQIEGPISISVGANVDREVFHKNYHRLIPEYTAYGKTYNKCQVALSGTQGYWVWFHEAYIMSMDITFQENVKVLGAGVEYTAYPRYPTQVSVTFAIPRHAEIQSSTSDIRPINAQNGWYPGNTESVNLTDTDMVLSISGSASGNTDNDNVIPMVQKAFRSIIEEYGAVSIISGMYGQFDLLPTDVATSHAQGMQGSVSLTGILQKYAQAGGPTLEGDEEYVDKDGGE